MTTPIPAGWKLVPIEPTEEMLVALGGMGWMVQQKPENYAAMLAAAPEAPPITVALDPDPRGVSVGVWQGSRCIYSGAHAVPEGAQPARDWELTCDHCNGSGHVFVKHQVAERKTDVQEFKEECERCEGRGFTIAFEDIPGIAEYVKSCRPSADAPLASMARAIFGDQISGQMDAMAGAPASVAPGDAQDEQVRHKMNADLCAFYMRWEADGDYLRCRKCKRPQIASYAEKGFPHAAGCKAVGNFEQRPWLALIELMRPLIGYAAPAAGDALALLDHPLLRDVLGYIEDAGPADVWSAAQSWMSLRDAELAAQRKGDA